MYLNVALPYVAVFTTLLQLPPIKAFTGRPIAGACSPPCRLIAEQNPHAGAAVKAAEGTATAAAALTGEPDADTIPQQMQGAETNQGNIIDQKILIRYYYGIIIIF